jgi:hypothetical protein
MGECAWKSLQFEKKIEGGRPAANLARFKASHL